MWQARMGKREEALTCAAGYRPHHQSISIHQPTQQRRFYATAKLYRSQIIGTTNDFGNPDNVGVFGECFGLADGYQLVGEVMAHQGDDGLPCCLKVGSQHQSISPTSAGNDRGFYGRRRLYDGRVLARHEARP